MDTEQVALLPVPMAGSLAVETLFPVPERGSVALAAKPVGFRELDEPSVRQMQKVAILGVVAIEAPTVGLVMTKLDLFVRQRQLTSIAIHLVLRVVAFAAWEDVLAEGGRRHRDFFLVGVGI